MPLEHEACSGGFLWEVLIFFVTAISQVESATFPKTNSSHLKIGQTPRRKGSSSHHQFSANMLVLRSVQ